MENPKPCLVPVTMEWIIKAAKLLGCREVPEDAVPVAMTTDHTMLNGCLIRCHTEDPIVSPCPEGGIPWVMPPLWSVNLPEDRDAS